MRLWMGRALLFGPDSHNQVLGKPNNLSSVPMCGLGTTRVVLDDEVHQPPALLASVIPGFDAPQEAHEQQYVSGLQAFAHDTAADACVDQRPTAPITGS